MEYAVALTKRTVPAEMECYFTVFDWGALLPIA